MWWMYVDLQARWDELLLCLEEHVQPRDIQIWFKGARPLHLEGSLLTLQVPNRYYAGWIRDNYTVVVNTASMKVFGSPIELAFSFLDDPTSEVPAPQAMQTSPTPPQASRQSNHQPAPSYGLNTSHTFGSFVIGECNRFAHAAALAVAESPADHYNPLYIYGETGLGKTHLMHAIGNSIIARDPSARVMYVTAEDFMNEMINSIRFKRTEAFRNKYRQQANVLIVDDIQFLSGKERTQEEFFFTFNALQTSGRQIVLASDVTPRDIKSLEPRLRTRFEGGLLADVQPPDHETLIAILGKKAADAGIFLPPDVIEAIAATGKTSIRELEGDVNRLAAFRRFFDQPLTLEFARRHMPEPFIPDTPNVSVPGIIEAVAKFHSLRSADITGKRRTRALTRPRHIAMHVARKHTQLSFPELGREFGGRDHSTIQHGCRKVENELLTNPDLAYQVRLIEQSLGLKSR
jgi:chromosomal replication initiator protein